MLTPKEVAKILKVSVQTVRNLCDSGRLKCIRPTGPYGHRRVLLKDLEAYIDSLRT